MSSRVIYPPILNSYSPAFVYGTDSICKVSFSLSTLNTNKEIGTAQAVVYKQGTGENIVNKTSSNNRYRSSGVILNLPIKEEDNDMFYIEILNRDIGINGSGWTPGDVYKIQIRLVEKGKEYEGKEGEATYLNKYADFFSEWSTVCVTKAIGIPIIDIPIFDYNSKLDVSNINSDKTLYISSNYIYGTYSCPESKNEYLYSYNISIENDNREIIESSDTIYTERYSDQDRNSFKYNIKHQLESGRVYIFILEYETINGYKNTIKIKIKTNIYALINNYYIKTIDYNEEDLQNLTSLNYENEEGVIGIKIYISSFDLSKQYGSLLINTNLCIRRTDDRSNFSEWEDLKIVNIINDNPNNYHIIYDYMIESGVQYKYGIQEIKRNQERTILNSMGESISREFEYSYLIGENGKKLKLMYNNEISSYKINVADSINQTIGRKYPFIMRNSNVYYKSFPFSGLISYNMDSDYQFIDNDDKYRTQKHDGISTYDFTYERYFRDKVYEFLYDGKPKLFKSPSEGNIIIRLTDISFTPEKSLNRLIYSFTATATEICENSTDNYKKYNIWEVGNFVKDLSTTDTVLGQLIFNIPINKNLNRSGNLIDYIVNKYDTQGFPYAGKVRKLHAIKNLNIEINGYYDMSGNYCTTPLKIYIQDNINNGVGLGNNIKYNDSIITIFTPFKNNYCFDSKIILYPSDQIVFLGDCDKNVSSIDITANFLCLIEMDDYIAKEIYSKVYSYNIGQIAGTYKSGDNIYTDLYYKYYIEHTSDYRRLVNIPSFSIEADPGTVFLINYEGDSYREEDLKKYYTDINETGLLNINSVNLIDLRYIGIRELDPVTGEWIINKDKKSDIIVNYYYYIETGKYRG